MEEIFRRKQEAKGVPAKAKSAKEKRSGKPAVDASLPWAEVSDGYNKGHDTQRAMADFLFDHIEMWSRSFVTEPKNVLKKNAICSG